MQRNDQTYWLIPRDVIDSDPSESDIHRALLAYVLLFSGPVLISDSAAIRSRFLRLGLRRDVEGSGDGFVRQLIDEKYLRVAIRERNGIAEPLAATAEGIEKDASARQVGYQPPGDTLEFRYIEERSDPLLYSLDGAAQRYHLETLRVFRDTVFTREQLPEKYRRALVDVLEDHVVRGIPFGLSRFQPDSKLWQQFVQRSGQPVDLYERYGRFIHAVARGPYATFFPERFGLRPTYSPDDRLGIDCWRGIHAIDKLAVDERVVLAKALRLSDFVAGLSGLTATDIHELRNSDERIGYEHGLHLYSAKLGSSQEVLGNLAAYRRRIDDRIMHRISGLTLEDTPIRGTISHIGNPAAAIVPWIVIDILLESIVPVRTIVTALLETLRYAVHLGRDRLRGLEDDAKRNADRAALREQIDRWEARKDSAVEGLTRINAPRIDASVTVERGAKLTTEVSVRSPDVG